MAPTSPVSTTAVSTSPVSTTAVSTPAVTTQAAKTMAPTTQAAKTMAPTPLVKTLNFNNENILIKSGVYRQGYTTIGTITVPADYIPGNNATVIISASSNNCTANGIVGEFDFGIAKGPSQGQQIATINYYLYGYSGSVPKDGSMTNQVKNNINLGTPGTTLYVGVNCSYPADVITNPGIGIKIQYHSS